MDHIIHRICFSPWGEYSWRVKYKEREKIDTPHQQQPKQLQKSICLLKMKYCIMILGRSMAAAADVVVGWLHLFIYLYFSFIFFGLYGTNIMSVSHTQPRMSMDKKSLLKYLWLRFFFLFEWCQHDFYLMLFRAFLMALWRVKKVNLSFELFIQWNVNMNMSLETEIEWKEKGKYWWVNFYIYFSWDLL